LQLTYSSRRVSKEEKQSQSWKLGKPASPTVVQTYLHPHLSRKGSSGKQFFKVGLRMSTRESQFITPFKAQQLAAISSGAGLLGVYWPSSS